MEKKYLHSENTSNKEFIFDENLNFQSANRFLANISGVDDYGNPKAVLLLRVGGEDQHNAQEYEIGPVNLTKRNMQGCFILDFHFKDVHTLKQCNYAAEQYAKYVDIMNGDVDSDHVLSMILFENQEYSTEYVIAQMPVFFGITSSEPGTPAMNYRFSFRKDTLFHFDMNAEALQE